MGFASNRYHNVFPSVTKLGGLLKLVHLFLQNISALKRDSRSLVTAEAGVCADRGVVAHVHAGLGARDGGRHRGPGPGPGARQGERGRGERLRALV